LFASFYLVKALLIKSEILSWQIVEVGLPEALFANPFLTGQEDGQLEVITVVILATYELAVDL